MKRITLHVEEQVARIRFWQAREAAARFAVDQFELILTGPAVCGPEERPGSVVVERRPGIQVRDAGFGRKAAKLADRLHARPFQLGGLGSLDIGNQAQMVIVFATGPCRFPSSGRSSSANTALDKSLRGWCSTKSSNPFMAWRTYAAKSLTGK